MQRGTRTNTRRLGAAIAAAAALLAMPALAPGHEGLDHAPPTFNPQGTPSMAAQAGGIEGVQWEFLASFPTGNPHTDIDFFQRGGKTYASVGTLGTGPNAGGQSIFQLADGDRFDPRFVAGVPTASCISNPSAALGLQHDVEATPKANTILNTDVQNADRRETQLLIDATDAGGRCHDQGTAAGFSGAPRGGLEIVDVTDPAKPVTIGMTSHIGEAHTVNVDPRRPHIAYAVTSDGVGVNADGTQRLNDTTEANDLDGWEVVDISSCMDFPAGTSVEAKRQACRPQVYRYRYDNLDMARGHTNNKDTSNGLFGCHELEVYPDDRLVCAAGNATMLFDMKGAFDDRGTPNNYLDDKPRGQPLPCRVRDSSSPPQLATGAKIVDCVTGENNQALTVPAWNAIGAPSLAGVKWLGSAYHQGREITQESATPNFPSSQDIDFSHEGELTHSGRYILATDERGGGVAPPGASCSPGADNPTGNGGIHAYRTDRLLTKHPANAEEAFTSYARNPNGGKAIHRTPIRTEPQAALCTAHVFHQIPGQNRIFMGWYAQGTKIIDFEENSDGTIEFNEIGYHIPANANQWVSAIWKVDRNPDGSFTYWGATGDFYIGDGGRGTVDLYRVTIKRPPPAPAERLPGTGAGFRPLGNLSIQRDSLFVDRRGRTTVRVSCLSGERCVGRLRLVTSKKYRTRSGKRAVLTLARANISLPAGARGARLRMPVSST
ncbi:MAG: hypothetical protein M3340_16545, partial [Actinomycetota bacterium]|nr:hypothetical protein [Actinomycetota bacterium]